ncbi:MAG: hypothetical protein HYX25_06870 [Candidatus Solibacter usitatus]|nr:hypothetical protein [Candidatus Solibacter usitatus]
MLALLAAVALPALYWDQGPATAAAVKQAGIERLYVPASEMAAWRDAGFDAQAFDAARFVKLPVPGVRYQMDVASATTVPWIDANGWRFQRKGGGSYFYDAPAGKAMLAAAEAYANGVEAVIHVDAKDLAGFARMLTFLRSIGGETLPALANFGFIDNGSAQTGEVMNLLARRNLLFEVVRKPDPKYEMNVEIPADAKITNPSDFSARVRQDLTDEKRLLRIFGSDVVLARLNGDNTRVRVHLINYSDRKVEGLRVRVRGVYSRGTLAAFGQEKAALEDFSAADGATEFTVPSIDVYAAMDLRK